MKKTVMIIFIDDVIREYINHYGNNAEKIMIKHLKKYLAELSKTSEIRIITCQNKSKIMELFLKNNLDKFIDSISNPNN